MEWAAGNREAVLFELPKGGAVDEKCNIKSLI
jgi:hypothetical protein